MPETRICIKCAEPYEPQYWEVLGVRILRGAGNCPNCSQAILEDEEAEEKAARELEINNTRHEHISLSKIPPKFLSQTFDTFEKGWQDKALAFCQKYAEEFPVDKRPLEYPSLYLWSQNSWGVGKTHLSCAIAHRIFERWTGEGRKGCPRIYFVSEPDLFRQIQATYSFNREQEMARESEDDILKRLIYCDLLILDDVGKEPRRDMHFVRRILFSIINGRYDKELPIILTANLAPSQLKAHLEDASFDRFFEMIQGKSVCMDGKSYRREAKNG